MSADRHGRNVGNLLRSDGRRFNQLMERPVFQPVFSVHGDADPALPADDGRRTSQRVTGSYRHHVLAGAGHFPHEEQPAAFTELLLGWLDDVHAT